MSYNLVDPTTGDLTRVAGNSNIVDTSIGIDSTWSSKKINDSLVELREGKKLTSIDNLDNIKEAGNYWWGAGNAPINATEIDGDTHSTTMVVSVVKEAGDGNAYSIQTVKFMLGQVMTEYMRFYNVNVGEWRPWIQLVTTVGTTQMIGFKTNLLNQCYGYYTIRNNKVSVHMKFVLSRALKDWESLTNANLPVPSSAVTKNANGKTGAPNSVYINTDGSMQQGGGGGMSAGTYEFDFEYTTA